MTIYMGACLCIKNRHDIRAFIIHMLQLTVSVFDVKKRGSRLTVVLITLTVDNLTYLLKTKGFSCLFST